jgi:hypothetical protein
MVSSIVHLNIVPKLMLTAEEAAQTCGFQNKKLFARFCPVKAIDLGDGKPRYDARDLDKWIDGHKQGQKSAAEIDGLIAQLA